MTTEDLPDLPSPGSTRSAIRPPDFLLPASEKGGAARRGAGPDVYVSWGGQVYGPATLDDVLSGVRTAYFEQDALFWFEGREQWRPVGELPDLLAAGESIPARRNPPAAQPAEGVRPHWPGSRRRRGSERGDQRRRGSKGRGGRSSRSQLGGRLIVIGAVLLAVLITAGLLLLISWV